MKGSLVSFTEAWEAKEHGWARCQNVTRRDGGLQVPGLRSAPTTISSAEPAVTAVAEEGLRCDTWYWRAFLNRPVTTSCPFPVHALNLVVRRETGPHRRVLPVWHLKILWVLFIHVFAPVFYSGEKIFLRTWVVLSLGTHSVVEFLFKWIQWAKDEILHRAQKVKQGGGGWTEMGTVSRSC